jgi:cytochrome c556
MPYVFGRKLILSLTCAATLLATVPAVQADDEKHDSDNNEARYRHSVMEAMGSSFGALALIMTNRVQRPDQLATQAKALAISASVTPTLFPAGSEGGDALPLIWQEQEKVAEAAQRAVDATAALAAAAEAGDKAALSKAFKAAGESCKGCHERYKAEDE